MRSDSLQRPATLFLMSRRVAAAAGFVAMGLSLLSSASEPAGAKASFSSSGRSFLYCVGVGQVGYADRCCPRRWSIFSYECDVLGMVRRADHYRGRWNVYAGGYGKGNVRIGYVQPASRGTWIIYASQRGLSGFVKHSHGNRWDVYGWSATTGAIHYGSRPAAGGGCSLSRGPTRPSYAEKPHVWLKSVCLPCRRAWARVLFIRCSRPRFLEPTTRRLRPPLPDLP